MSELDGLHRLELPALDRRDLGGRVWRFGVLDEPPYARHVRLLEDGRIAGNLGANESRWAVDGGRLLFLDAADRRSTVFDRAYVDAEGRLALVGRFQSPEGRDHILQELPGLGAMAEPDGGVELIWRRRGAPRPNLIVIRANEKSLHQQWPRDLLAEDRSWDLCVSWYGREENFVAEDWPEFRVLQNRVQKYAALHQLMHRGSPLWNYDYIALPDDDVMASWGDWNAAFAICREHRLELAQPALKTEGHVAHPITGRDPRYKLRYVSFVEGMTPIFSRGALQACIGSFQHSRSGFGLDNIWPKLLGEPRDRMAIIDAVPMLHTRPQGGAYNIEAAIEEGNAVQHAYDAPSHVLEYGGIFAEPVNRQHAW